jgi:hypothetical protein
MKLLCNKCLSIEEGTFRFADKCGFYFLYACVSAGESQLVWSAMRLPWRYEIAVCPNA